MKCGNLNFLEPSGPIQACNGTALPLLGRLRCVKLRRPHSNHGSLCLVRVPLWPDTPTDDTTVQMKWQYSSLHMHRWQRLSQYTKHSTCGKSTRKVKRRCQHWQLKDTTYYFMAGCTLPSVRTARYTGRSQKMRAITNTYWYRGSNHTKRERTPLYTGNSFTPKTSSKQASVVALHTSTRYSTLRQTFCNKGCSFLQLLFLFNLSSCSGWQALAECDGATQRIHTYMRQHSWQFSCLYDSFDEEGPLPGLHHLRSELPRRFPLQSRGRQCLRSFSACNAEKLERSNKNDCKNSRSFVAKWHEVEHRHDVCGVGWGNETKIKLVSRIRETIFQLLLTTACV